VYDLERKMLNKDSNAKLLFHSDFQGINFRILDVMLSDVKKDRGFAMVLSLNTYELHLIALKFTDA
jgi:hypothetical protein